MKDQTPEVFVDVHFPCAGIDLSGRFSSQQPRPVTADKVYSRSTVSAMNVRAYEATKLRRRGGQRPGLSKYIPVALIPNTQWIVQDLNLIVRTGGTGVQTSNSGRVVTVVAVSQGNVYYANAGDTTWTTAVNNTGETPPLNFTGIIYSSANNQKLYFADGINYAYFDPSLGSVQPWVATAGALPVDANKNTPRLICTWRGRTILSGLILDPQNWFMSAVSDPTNFDYSPLSTTPAQAVAGSASTLGLIGDVVTALMPFNDDLLLVGTNNGLWSITGDPMAGGQIDRISDVIGVAWGQGSWVKNPLGVVYWISNKTGVYQFMPGMGLPQRISGPIEQLLVDLDMGGNVFTMTYDTRFQAVNLFITPVDGGVTTHLCFEERSGAWWQDEFANSDHNPVTACTFEGNTPGDRCVLIGSWDGYVRKIDGTAGTDDGTPITSSVLLGPLVTDDLDEILCKDIQGVLGATSGPVTYEVLIGPTAEQALAAGPVMTGSFLAGRGPTKPVRRAGHAVYLQLNGLSPWAMEEIRFRISTLGKVRRRRPGSLAG